MVLDGPINADWFEAYVGKVLVPDPRRGDVVIMDNLSSHKRASVREAIEAIGARLLSLPAIQPRLQSDRESLLLPSRPCSARLADRIRNLVPHRQAGRRLPAAGVRQLLRSRRL
jgi:hypothetical protein